MLAQHACARAAAARFAATAATATAASAGILRGGGAPTSPPRRRASNAVRDKDGTEAPATLRPFRGGLASADATAVLPRPVPARDTPTIKPLQSWNVGDDRTTYPSPLLGSGPEASDSAGATPTLPSELYESLQRSGLLRGDEVQRALLPRLDELHAGIVEHQSELREWTREQLAWEASRAAAERRELERREAESVPLGDRLRVGLGMSPVAEPPPPVESLSDSELGIAEPPPRPAPPRGLYVAGDVGVGKTMLADILFASLSRMGNGVLCRRVHFNSFLLELYSRLHRYNLGEERRTVPVHATGEHPLVVAARELLGGADRAHASLLCLDEFQITEVGDAVLIQGVLRHLLDLGTTIVSTSNRAPDDLDRAKLQSYDFEEFLRLLKERVDVVLLESPRDHRAANAADARLEGSASPTLVHPLGAEADATCDGWFAQLAAGEPIAPADVPILFGRSISIERAAGDAVAMVEFDELCDAPRGPSDFLALTKRFRAVVLRDVPRLKADDRDLVRRLIWLVDEAYNSGCVLYMSSEVPVDEIFDTSEADRAARLDLAALQEAMTFETEVATRSRVALEAPLLGVGLENRATLASREGAASSSVWSGEDEAFAWRRACSRLTEMQSARYRNIHSCFG